MSTSENSGFTIVELLAAMVISSLVLAFVGSIYIFGERLVASWHRRADLTSLVYGSTWRIVLDIQKCTDVYGYTDSTLTIEKNQLDTIEYRFNNGKIWRNGVSFSTTSVKESQCALNALVTFSVDTGASSGQAFRLWCVQVTGQSGGLKDSSIVYLATLMSSEELFRRNKSLQAHS